MGSRCCVLWKAHMSVSDYPHVRCTYHPLVLFAVSVKQLFVDALPPEDSLGNNAANFQEDMSALLYSNVSRRGVLFMFVILCKANFQMLCTTPLYLKPGL